MKRTFGEKLRDFRKDKDLSQKELAALIPMNQSNYSKIELDKQEPSLFQLKRIAEILEISVDKLLDIGRPTVTIDEIKKLQNDLDKLFEKLFP
jgi:transcriptional regulator with XRE-family HTH domain